MARNYVVGLVQKITYQEFLPILMGRQGYNRIIGSYQGYNENVNPEVAIEFSTAGFRIGHTLLVDRYLLVNKDKSIEREFKLEQVFIRPDLITD